MRFSQLLACAMILASGTAAGAAGPAPDKELTRKECGACHMPYPPMLLPARSWEAITGNLKEHFGEDASLSPDATAAIRKFLVGNAADANGQVSGFIRGVADDQTPMRITELPFFNAEHGRFRDEAVKKVGTMSNCLACHK